LYAFIIGLPKAQQAIQADYQFFAIHDFPDGHDHSWHEALTADSVMP
jgi:hypothetical protein